MRSTCLPRKVNCIQFSPQVKLLASRQTGTTSYFKQVFKAFQKITVIYYTARNDGLTNIYIVRKET